MYWKPMPAGGLGFGITTGTLSGPVKPLITSTKSPGLMIVPTPEIWSTWTAIPTRPAGTSMLSMPPLPPVRTAEEMYCPDVTLARAIWPTTKDGSAKLSPGFWSIGTSLVVTSVDWIVAPRSMFWDATTILAVVGTGVTPGGGLEP